MAYPIHRRTLLLGGTALLLASCADDDPPPAESAGTEGRFPATAEHAYGTTTVERRPERIAIVGVTEQDIVLALGHTPVATTEWYGEHPYAVWPWAVDALGDAEPTVLKATDRFDYERIASVAPDLIVGTNSGMTKAEYDALSELAPTVAPPRDTPGYFSSWKTQTRLIGDALGLRDDAERLIDGIDRRLATQRLEHPEFEGRSVVFLQNAISDGSYIAYPPGLSTGFLTSLGLRIPDYLERYRRGAEQSYIPAEQIDVVDDADVLLWATEAASDLDALENEATFMNLAPVEEGRSVYTDGILAGAIYFTTPLSLPYVLDRLPALLADAIDGGAPREIST